MQNVAQNNPTRRSKCRCSYTGLFQVGSFAKWLRG